MLQMCWSVDIAASCAYVLDYQQQRHCHPRHQFVNTTPLTTQPIATESQKPCISSTRFGGFRYVKLQCRNHRQYRTVSDWRISDGVWHAVDAVGSGQRLEMPSMPTAEGGSCGGEAPLTIVGFGKTVQVRMHAARQQLKQ